MQTSTRRVTETPQAEEPPTIAAARSNDYIIVHLLKAMRRLQSTTNGLLFAGLLFALKFTDVNYVLKAIAGFVLFCMFSSSIYIINDLRDREKDAINPRTRKRPIASGALNPRIALAFVSVLLPATFIFSYLLNPA